MTKRPRRSSSKTEIQRTCLLVLGMHRSGTSALARALNLLGASLPQSVMGADEGNEAGHWEPARLVAYHEQFLGELGSSWYDWRPLDLTRMPLPRRDQAKADIQQIIETEYSDAPLFVVKDPRICRFATFFIKAVEELGIRVVPVIVFRNPLEVSASLRRRSRFWPAEFTDADAALLWLSHILEAERATRGRSRAVISYDGLMSDWRKVATEIAQKNDLEFPLALDEAAPLIDEFLNGDMRHHARKTGEVALDPVLRGWVSEAFEATIKLSASSAAAQPTSVLDRVRSEFLRSVPIINSLLSAAAGARAVDLKAAEEAGARAASAEAELAESAAALAAVRDQAAVVESDLASRGAELEQIHAELEQMKTLERDLVGERDRLRSANDMLENQLTEQADYISRAREALGAESGDNRDLDQLIDGLNVLLANREEALSKTRSTLEAEKRKIQRLQDRLDEKSERTEEELKAANQKIEESERELNRSSVRVMALESEIATVRRDYAKIQMEFEYALAAYQSSTSWKLTAPLRGAKYALRFFGKAPMSVVSMVGQIPNSVRFAGGVLPAAKKAARVYREEGLAGVKWRMDYATSQNISANLFRARSSQSSKPASFPAYSKNDSTLKKVAKPVGGNAETTPPKEEKSNSDKNPAAVNGWEESSSPLQTGELKRHILEGQEELSERVSQWISGKKLKITSPEEFGRKIEELGSGIEEGIIVSITHDDYRHVVGGIQLCVQLEQRNFSEDRYLYLNLHPTQPLPVLSTVTDIDSFYFQVIANGELIGTMSAASMLEAIERLQPKGKQAACIIHALHGHSPEIIAKIVDNIGIKKSIYWMHDYYSACQNHLLLRNDIEYCGAPPVNSVSCNICLYGSGRAKHIERIKSLFESAEFDVVAPSGFALEKWKSISALPYGKASVVEHSRLVPLQTLAPDPAPDDGKNPVRIAFLGYPTAHKGWLTFSELAAFFANDKRFEFHHLGQQKTSMSSIRFTEVSTTAQHPNAMVDALVVNKIDITVIWAAWPETYSFTLHEALAAGTLVVTNHDSGNVQATISNSKKGWVASSEKELIDMLGSDQLLNRVREQRKNGRNLFATEYSLISRQLVN